MKLTVIAVIFYVLASWQIVTIEAISPTNMAGPGLDVVVFLLSVAFTVLFLVISLIKLNRANKISYLNLAINLVGAGIVMSLLYWQMTKPR